MFGRNRVRDYRSVFTYRLKNSAIKNLRSQLTAKAFLFAQENFAATFKPPIVAEKLENRRRVNTNSRISFAVKI